MLHLGACDGQHVDEIDAPWAGLDSAVRRDHGVIVTVTGGDDDAIY
jgi:hypothetical protein